MRVDLSDPNQMPQDLEPEKYNGIGTAGTNSWRKCGAAESIIFQLIRVLLPEGSLRHMWFLCRRYLNWKKKSEDEIVEEEVLTYNSYSHIEEEDQLSFPVTTKVPPLRTSRKKLSVSKLRSALTVFGKNKSSLGTKVIGTLFGYRRGHVHFAFQEDARMNPPFLIELATPTSFLVREMASGLVRIALECEKKPEKKGVKLLEEPVWRTYCNGKKCGYATRRECGLEEWKVLQAVGPVSMGAGVLPGEGDGGGSEGELMYMRARFERVVGSKDSEAFYMMNPDGSGGPELSVFLLRV